MEQIKKLLLVLIPAALLALFFLVRPASTPEPVPQLDPAPITDPQPEAQLDENGVYDTKDEVALYLYTYQHLPHNYMTKKEARKLGWDEGPLHLVEEGMCLGGDVFANREGLLPQISGHYYECDIDTLNAKQRGEKRIVWSDDFDIYYTDDYYQTFVKLYDSPGSIAHTPVNEPDPKPAVEPDPDPTPEIVLDENGVYDTKDEVALYLITYHHLPYNYMTKKEARKLGWESGALNQTVKGKCIGGDVYSNYEGVLPEISGNYYECDIDTINKKRRGEKRLIWSDDWDIYYTDDHYETFVQLYGD